MCIGCLLHPGARILLGLLGGARAVTFPGHPVAQKPANAPAHPPSGRHRTTVQEKSADDAPSAGCQSYLVIAFCPDGEAVGRTIPLVPDGSVVAIGRDVH